MKTPQRKKRHFLITSIAALALSVAGAVPSVAYTGEIDASIGADHESYSAEIADPEYPAAEYFDSTEETSQLTEEGKPEPIAIQPLADFPACMSVTKAMGPFEGQVNVDTNVVAAGGQVGMVLHVTNNCAHTVWPIVTDVLPDGFNPAPLQLGRIGIWQGGGQLQGTPQAGECTFPTASGQTIVCDYNANNFALNAGLPGLAVGATGTLTITGIASCPANGNQIVNNQLTVGGTMMTGGWGPAINVLGSIEPSPGAPVAITVSGCAAADLALTKTPASQNATAGSQITWNLTATNNGPDT
ncbi:MAG: DUF11 domain-containing protein, partial [Promicromonosporaceae bacterium]|nr:DUF11 domain-containing protein [Promicromonosporaceae bacterium]